MVLRYTRVGAKASTVFLLCVGLATLAALGCSSGGVEIGPVHFDVSAITGTLSVGQSSFEEVVTFCEIPNERELRDYVRSASFGIDISRFVQVSRIELVGTTITATTGDFRDVTRVTMYYVPADGGAERMLGTASSPSGFGSSIVLEPPASVDFLRLVRENDAITNGQCPELRIEVDVNGELAGAVAYRIDVSLDVYGRLGF